MDYQAACTVAWPAPEHSSLQAMVTLELHASVFQDGKLRQRINVHAVQGSGRRHPAGNNASVNLLDGSRLSPHGGRQICLLTRRFWGPTCLCV